MSITKEIVPKKFANKHVILVDELFDNRKTMCSVKLLLLEKMGRKIKSITTCVMFRNLPDVWLVGYGLDYNGEARGCPDLWCVRKTDEKEKTDDDQMFEDDKIFKKLRSRINKKI